MPPLRSRDRHGSLASKLTWGRPTLDPLIATLVVLGVAVAAVVTVAIVMLIRGDLDNPPNPTGGHTGLSPTAAPAKKLATQPPQAPRVKLPVAQTPSVGEVRAAGTAVPSAASAEPVKSAETRGSTAGAGKPRSAPTPPSAAGSPPAVPPVKIVDSRRRLRERWSALPLVARSAMVAAPVAVLAVVVVGAVVGGRDGGAGSGIGGGTDDRDSQFVEQLARNQNISIDQRAAVDMAKTACHAPLQGEGLYNAQEAMQQRHPEYSLSTVATVMAQGILVYCPERLS